MFIVDGIYTTSDKPTSGSFDVRSRAERSRYSARKCRRVTSPPPCRGNLTVSTTGTRWYPCLVNARCTAIPARVRVVFAAPRPRFISFYHTTRPARGRRVAPSAVLRGVRHRPNTLAATAMDKSNFKRS
ncbi:hypothetical protein EVAR_22661_1 [Eumeta japonica]|uniref:Uncharacterized protein n=1 Tax=Eumeta variegata TaxID=151549 RepID=A0A4C1VNB7_EUMVA|nr:hypothetical protein EVAR_22661_1 [Eumeta japonica]